jgi:hypothetical protein
MTEADWLACEDPIAMIEFLRGSPVGEDRVSWGKNSHEIHLPQRGNDRRFRLFACWCCRRIWRHIPEPVNHAAVVAVEELLEGRMSSDKAWAALCASSSVEHTEQGRRSEPGYWAVKHLGRGFYKMTAGASALLIASSVICMMDADYGPSAKHAFDCSYYPGGGVFLTPFRWPLPMPTAIRSECSYQVATLRDVFGNPFRPVAIDPAWRTATVLSLAQRGYDDRDLPAGHLDPDCLAILSDALEDAGCADATLLRHLRSSDPHVRGCWALDLILGKK